MADLRRHGKTELIARQTWDELTGLPWPDDVTTLEYFDLVGLKEITDRLGLKPNTANVWRQRGQFPEPDLELAMGPLWKWSTVETWARETGRLK